MEGCQYKCNHCNKLNKSNSRRSRPEELEEFLNEDGYFKFGITCVRQAQFLFKIIFDSDVKLIFPTMFVGEIKFSMKIDDEGVFIARTNKKGVRIPESNNTSSVANDKVLDLTRQLKFAGILNRDDILNCLNFILHPVKVNLAFATLTLAGY
jgi:hypothetical protein